MLEKSYDPKPVEARFSELWAKAGLFKGDASKGDGSPFVIVIPPPNVTGALHLGHALNNTLQDLLIRYHKLRGRPVCWIPGTDHGGIATQNVMEKQLKAEGKSRHDLGREEFLKRMQAWAAQCKNTILGQLRALGCGLDWSREAFTMDEVRARSVHHSFGEMWRKGLIYRGERMVNWCVRCGTALSDIEVEHEERKGKLWHIRYGTLVVATTRPETMLGDTAVAVNPQDERYKALVGTRIKLPLTDREIPIVADEHVDPAFGTGAVKVTPAHDPNDFEIMLRHPKEIGAIKVISAWGKMTDDAGPEFAGLSREQARDKAVALLGEKGFLEKIEDHKHAVGVCYRCSQVIEPLLSWQWFVKMKDLAEPALKALDDGRFKIHPQSWAKPYREWLSGIRDWCVSRQIWWGHQIPVWYCRKCNPAPRITEHVIGDAKGIFGAEKPAKCPDCGGSDLIRDPDVLDTWFSSGLWPMSVFGWPDQTPDIKRFYPTKVLVTGYEILYLWVARMQMMGLEFMGRVPFDDALIHGIVRDKSGKKMSKSLGNVIDPLDMMAKYGTDALRFALAAQAHPGRDIPFAEESLTGARNFANKIWNSARFVLMYLPEKAPAGGYPLPQLSHCCLELADRWILAEYQALLKEYAEKLEKYEVAAAADLVYAFLWDKFCDWYVELAKIRLQGPEGEEKQAAVTILVQVLTGTLKLLHPFMPFITEELYAALKPYAGESAEFLLNSGYPGLEMDWSNEEARGQMRVVMEAIVQVRTARAQLNVPPGLKLKALLGGGDQKSRGLVLERGAYVKALARLEAIEDAPGGSRPASSATAVFPGGVLYLPLEGVIDFAKERARLEKELAKAESDLSKCAAKLENRGFMDRAPEAEKALARSQRDAAQARLDRLKETLHVLS